MSNSGSPLVLSVAIFTHFAGNMVFKTGLRENKGLCKKTKVEHKLSAEELVESFWKKHRVFYQMVSREDG